MSTNALLFKYAFRHRLWITLSLVLGFSGALFNGVSSTLVIPVLMGLGGQDDFLNQFPPAFRAFLTWFDRFPEEYRALAMIAVIVLAIVLKNVANYASSLTNARLSQVLTRDFREEGLRILLEVDLDYHFKMRTGDIIQQLNDQVAKATSAIRMLINFSQVVINSLFLVGLLLLISWQLTITAACLMSVVVLLNQVTIQRSKVFGSRLAELSKNYSIRLLEMLNGIRLIKATGNEPREYQKVRDLIRAREAAALASQANFARIGPINEIASVIALMLMVLVGRVLFANQAGMVGTVLLTYLFLLSRLIPFLGQLNASRSEFANAVASVEIVHEFLKLDNKPFMARGHLPYKGIKTGIEFHDLSFRYPDTGALVLRGINLSLPRGTTLALVGASGAGKSTLADLLPRFYDPTAGSILIDGVDLREFEIGGLRSHMGIVSQETFLFNDSVRYNIAYARPDADEAAIIDAARRANAYEFIERLPQGLDTQIGDRGVLLSGGQRQRLSIARALLQDPDILILDEATSALDTVSERLVQRALEDLRRDRTTLVIAHRLSTVQQADQIAVLDQGRLVELGTHTELLQQGGYYAQLYALQFNETPQHLLENRIRITLKHSSYDMRTELNSMLGSLQLLVNHFIDTPTEQQELLEEAYTTALNLLKSIESLEKNLSPQISEQALPDKVSPLLPKRSRQGP